MSYQVAILIISDRAARGERADRCLPVFEASLAQCPFEMVRHELCSDDPDDISASLNKLLKTGPHLIFTCGGTGCAARDNTPEVTMDLIDRATPGIDEAIRRFSLAKSSFAMYSRAVSGFAGETLIINLPGSPTAVSEILEFILPTLEHPLRLRRSEVNDCADEHTA